MKTVEQLLREDHTRLDRLLSDLIDAFNRRDPTLAFRKLDLFWALLAVHIRAEHLHLFPALLSVAGQTPRVTELIESLREDHNFFMHELAIAIKTLRNQDEETGREVLISVREIINGVAKRLAHHNEIEETEIYPFVSLVCNKTAERRITAGIGKELANIPQRFKRSFTNHRFKMINDNIDGFILAGGANSRMGRRKAALKLGGQTFVEIARSSFSEVTNNIRVIGEKDVDAIDDGLEWVPDIYSEEKSSLLGLATALTYCEKTWAFVLACDLPFVSAALVTCIASFRSDSVDAIVPIQADGRLQPLCALYRRDTCVKNATEMLKTGNRSLHSLVRHLNSRLIEFSEISDLTDSDRFFTNINTPEDFKTAQNILSRSTTD